jgi:basic membrane protein A
MAYRGLERIKNELQAETAFSEWVPPPDAERYIRNYAELEYDVILVHDFLMGDSMYKVAKDYPDIKFIWAGGFYGYFKEPLPNIYYFQSYPQEAAYLAGWLSAGMSKSGIVGIVNAYPVPTLTATAEGFKLGVRAYNEKHGTNVKMMEIYTYDWEDTGKAKEAAISHIDAGADVIFGSGDSMVFGVSEACKERNVWQVGGIGDQHTLSPNTILTSVIWRIDNMYIDLIKKILDGTISSTTTYTYGMAAAGAELAPYYALEEKIPKALRDEIKQLTDDIIAGKLTVPFVTEQTPA